jgi:hypothetical protein
MIIKFKEYRVYIADEPGFRPGSADNPFKYERVYYDDGKYQPTSKHGIKVTRDGRSITSAIICETGGATGIHDNAFMVSGDNLVICCSDTVYSLKLPELTINWKKEFDSATCYSVYPFKDDFIIHGELEIKRVDMNGNVKWNFSAGDIFATQDGTEAMKIVGDRIEITDWNGNKYTLNGDGKATL